MAEPQETTIIASLLEAFGLIWGMYEEAIEDIPDEHWRTGEIGYLIPSRLVYHVLETADYYSGEDPEGFPWGRRFGVDPWDAPPERLPSKEGAMEYHGEVVDKIRSWLGGLDDSDLLSREAAFSWTGSTLLGRVLYLLAHYRQHMGEINAELRRRGLPRIKWRTL